MKDILKRVSNFLFAWPDIQEPPKKEAEPVPAPAPVEDVKPAVVEEAPKKAAIKKSTKKKSTK